MKILMINKNEVSGGSAQVCQTIINGLKTRGFQTFLFCSRPEKSPSEAVPIKTRLFSKIAAYLTSNDLDYYYGDRILETEEFKQSDLVHLHNVGGHFFRLATIRRIAQSKPIIWTFHDMYPINHYFAHSFKGFPRNGLFTGASPRKITNLIWWNRFYLKARKIAIYKDTDFLIVSPSAWLAGKIGLTVLKDKKLEIINNGVDVNKFYPGAKEAARANLGIPSNRRLILTVSADGRNSPLKGWRFVKNLANHCPDALFLSIGNSRAGLEGNIILEGNINNQDELRSYYQAADLLLMPSIAENFPLSSLEAMACGTPVVAFRVGGLAEQIDHCHDGYLADPQDAGDLIKGIDWIYSHRGDALAEACRAKIISKFSASLMVENYISLYHRIIKDYENRY